MPELPEVATIVSDLAPRLVGRQVVGIEILWPGVIGYHSTGDFQRRLVGQRIVGVRRRAKYIIVDLSGAEKLVLHLRMTGRLLLRPAETEQDRFARVVFRLDSGDELRFADARKFGRLYLWSTDEVTGLDRSLGPEPLEPEFTPALFREMVRRRASRLKPLLLDQTFLAGLGNIYVDEALYEARIHPTRRANSLSDEEIARLYCAVRSVLQTAIMDRGTTFASYVDALGRPGKHQLNVHVYRQAGEQCPRCGTPIERIVVAGRGTYVCPKCQALTIVAA